MESKKFEEFQKEAKQYKKILLEYKKTKKPFVDPTFHPTKNIKEREVGIDDSMDSWVRIDEVCNAPLFQNDIISSDFVQQGELGDCYFLSALSRIAKQPYLVPPLFDRDTPNQILGRVKDSINLKCGAVVVYFHCFGRKTPVLIDTLVPTKYGQIRFSHPSDNKKSPWFCLVEKAFAKLNGSYSDIVGGNLPQAIYSLYGYYPRNRDFEELEKPEKLAKMSVFDRLMKYQKKGAVMGTSINIAKLKNGITNDELEKKGLIAGHCYLLLKAREHDGKQFLCLRNPWGDHEWNGDYSDESSPWTPELKEGLGWNAANDGTFWMLDRDYFRYFTSIEVSLPLPPEWYARRYFVQLRPGDHDGYNVESTNAKIAERPNFAFQVTEPIPEGEKCRFQILVEKRHKLYDESKGSIWDPPQYCVLLAHSNGRKLSPGVLLTSNRYQMQSKMALLSFSYEVTGNDDIVTIAIHRLQRCNLIEDCYVLVYCEKDFKLYDIDHPDELIPEEYNAGIVFDNFSTRHPDVANPLKKKKIKNNVVLTFDSLKGTEAEEMRDKLKERYKEEIEARKKEPFSVKKPKSSSSESDSDDDDIKSKEKDKEEALKAKDKEKEEALKQKEKEKDEAIKAKEKEKQDAIKAKEKEKNDAIKAKEKEKEEALREKEEALNEANEEIERLRALLKSAQRQKKEKENLISKMEENLKSQEEIDELKIQLEKEKKEIALEKEKINSEKRKARKLIDEEVKRKIRENEEKKRLEEAKEKTSDDDDKHKRRVKRHRKSEIDDVDEKPKEDEKKTKKISSSDDDKPKGRARKISKVDSSDDEKPKEDEKKTKKTDPTDDVKPKGRIRRISKVDSSDDDKPKEDDKKTKKTSSSDDDKPKGRARKISKVDSSDDEKPKEEDKKTKKTDPTDDVKPKGRIRKISKVDSSDDEKPKEDEKKAKKFSSSDDKSKEEEKKTKKTDPTDDIKPKGRIRKISKIDSSDDDKPKEEEKKTKKTSSSDDDKPKEEEKKTKKTGSSDDEKPKEEKKETVKKTDSSDDSKKEEPTPEKKKPKKANKKFFTPKIIPVKNDA